MDAFSGTGNLSAFGDWQNALKKSVHELDWDRINQVKEIELDGPLPKKLKVMKYKTILALKVRDLSLIFFRKACAIPSNHTHDSESN